MRTSDRLMYRLLDGAKQSICWTQVLLADSYNPTLALSYPRFTSLVGFHGLQGRSCKRADRIF